jgi:hypothetical protein
MPTALNTTGQYPNAKLAKSSKNRGKSHEDFPLAELDQLLCTVIKVNPYMVPKNKKGEKWKEVRTKVQKEGFYLGRKA